MPLVQLIIAECKPRLATPEQRAAVVATLIKLGPRTGLPTLRALHPELTRAQLHELLNDYRRNWREEHKYPMTRLCWTTPGNVWAVDFTKPEAPIDGNFERVLIVRRASPADWRDSGAWRSGRRASAARASGVKLLPLPRHAEDSDTVRKGLQSLFERHGAPLCIKSDNGGAFIEACVQGLLAAKNVQHLFSPPRCPRYNGNCEGVWLFFAAYCEKVPDPLLSPARQRRHYPTPGAAVICSKLNPSATKSSAPGATPGPRASRSGTRAKPSTMSSAPDCANSATTAAKTDWPNFAQCCGSSGAATQRSFAERPARQRRLATNKLLLRQRSGREAPLTEARLLRSLARARWGAGRRLQWSLRERASRAGCALARVPGPAKAPAELCRSTSWPVWSVRHSPTRWSNSVFCRTGGGSLLRPLNSTFAQRISSGHTATSALPGVGLPIGTPPDIDPKLYFVEKPDFLSNNSGSEALSFFLNVTDIPVDLLGIALAPLLPAGAEIFLNVCEIGLNDFAQFLADATNAVVYAPAGCIVQATNFDSVLRDPKRYIYTGAEALWVFRRHQERETWHS